MADDVSPPTSVYEDKQEILIHASQNLSDQVARLTRVVGEQNTQVDNLRSELNRKPDDIELSFVADFAVRERKRLTRILTGAAVGCGVLSLVSSVLVSHSFASAQIHERIKVSHVGCVAANARIRETAGAFTDTANEIVSSEPKVQEFKAHLLTRAQKITDTRQDCDGMYPLK